MTICRVILSTLLFMAALVLVYMLFDGFAWSECFAAIGCFVLAHLLWPSKKRGKRQEESGILDVLELLIELPVDVFGWLLRLLSRLFRGGESLDL